MLHEVVRRRVARRGKPYAAKHNVWLLSPQRLIAGMMYVGQWEGRAAGDPQGRPEAAARPLLRRFPRPVPAPASAATPACRVADVLKPYILRREVRVLAEMTPEAWQALQERDRGLADQFHVLRIAATERGADAARDARKSSASSKPSIAASSSSTRCPPIVQLHQQLHPRRGVSRQVGGVLAAARAEVRQGSRSRGRDVHRRVPPEDRPVAGAARRPAAARSRRGCCASCGRKSSARTKPSQAAADVVTRRQGPARRPGSAAGDAAVPGPTGVGKTQCAKALAAVMFSDASRLLRFDMNEYVTPHAVAQLVGTFDEPDGLLDGGRPPPAVRGGAARRDREGPSGVFDLLLQVTGEGRLTDALGRTADFSNTVIVMTSNLGTTAGTGQIGLAPATADAAARRYVKAAEKFFRPEFFNRIDRVIPFESLSRDEMRQIAELLLADVFQRDGLVRRRCALAVEPAAMERIVDAGYHPQFGARALKRAIERQLVQPVAASLAGVKPELPAVISVYPHAEGVTRRVQPLESVPPVGPGALRRAGAGRAARARGSASSIAGRRDRAGAACRASGRCGCRPSRCAITPRRSSCIRSASCSRRAADALARVAPQRCQDGAAPRTPRLRPAVPGHGERAVSAAACCATSKRPRTFTSICANGRRYSQAGRAAANGSRSCGYEAALLHCDARRRRAAARRRCSSCTPLVPARAFAGIGCTG